MRIHILQGAGLARRCKKRRCIDTWNAIGRLRARTIGHCLFTFWTRFWLRYVTSFIEISICAPSALLNCSRTMLVDMKDVDALAGLLVKMV